MNGAMQERIGISKQRGFWLRCFLESETRIGCHFDLQLIVALECETIDNLIDWEPASWLC